MDFLQFYVSLILFLANNIGCLSNTNKVFIDFLPFLFGSENLKVLLKVCLVIIVDKAGETIKKLISSYQETIE